MNGKKRNIYIGFSLLVVLVSFVINFGFSNAEKSLIQNISFASIILTEIIFLSSIYSITRKEMPLFVKAGISSISVIYLVASFVVNVFLQAVLIEAKALISTNIVLVILYLAIILMIYLFKKEK